MKSLLSVSSLVVCCSIGVAQTTTGTVSGFIRDSSDAPISGAGVKLTDINTGYSRTTTASVEGAYTFPLVPPGSYELRVEQSGFQPWARSFTVQVH